MRTHAADEAFLTSAPAVYRETFAIARPASEVWAELTAAHKNYAGYQTKTSREIPVVLLTPA